MTNLAAIVLAAGHSSRMGSFKPLLRIGTTTTLERAISTFIDAGIADVRVVTGHRAEVLRPVLETTPAHEIFNPRYDAGMFTSVIAGIRSLAPQVNACFILPGDIPLVRPETIRLLVRAFESSNSTILYPVTNQRRGHPPLIARSVLDAILTSGDSDLRTLLAAHEANAADVEVADPGIHFDMDTPADLEAIRAHAVPTAEVLSETESVCPVCLQRIAAQRIAEAGNVYLSKRCPDHGSFRTIVWRGLPAYQSWGASSKPSSNPPATTTATGRGCPFECGLCPDHRQHTCCVVLEVTHRCNLACEFCFAASSDHGSDPSLETIEDRCRHLLRSGSPANLQLSGGEPTLRSDLPDIITLAHSLGFPFTQLNTNGLRLAAEPAYVAALKRAGLGCVFLQFDGVTDDIYRRLRGRALLDIKLAAIRNCRDNQLGVVLVPTLVPGLNTPQIGDILRFAIEQMPAVRAVHFQPVSYVGRFPRPPADSDRITIPEVLREIERQTEGKLQAAQFCPPSAENAYCSFQGKFFIHPDGTIRPSTSPAQSCCGSASTLVQLGGGEASRRARQFVARQWAFPKPAAAAPSPGVNTTSLDAFLAEQQNAFSISGMAFQDAWNLDLGRLRECFLHAADGDGRLVPLCAYNLTGSNGDALYRSAGAR